MLCSVGGLVGWSAGKDLSETALPLPDAGDLSKMALPFSDTGDLPEIALPFSDAENLSETALSFPDAGELFENAVPFLCQRLVRNSFVVFPLQENNPKQPFRFPMREIV